MSKKTVAITGAAGFIGSNLVRYLLERDYDIYGVDDLSSGKLEFLSSIPNFDVGSKFYYSDFTHPSFIQDVIKQKFDVIFHLAAKPRILYSVENPVETNDTNVSKTLSLIDLARGNIQRFVFSSSSSVYGDALERPTKEVSTYRPKSPYALQKATIEKYLEQYYVHYGLDSCSLRYFNVFGPNQVGDSPYSTAIGAWLDAIKNDKKLRSDGTGEQSRDMCYVDNVCYANYLAAEFNGNLKADTFNVATGNCVTNNEILNWLNKKHCLFDSCLYDETQSKIIHGPFRAGDVMHTLADISKSKAILGYAPIVQFFDGLQKTYDWYMSSKTDGFTQTVADLNPLLDKLLKLEVPQFAQI